jgi:hypothetical protein
MNAKRIAMMITICFFLTVSLSLSGCGPGQMFGPTMTPTPTQTPAPTQIPTVDIKSPVTVGSAQLLIVMATNDTTLYDTGPFAIQHAPDVTILHVEGKIVSGTIDLSTFSNDISLTDGNGNKCSLVSSGTEKPFWEFMVPVASKSFTLHLPDGQLVNLDSILKIVP